MPTPRPRAFVAAMLFLAGCTSPPLESRSTPPGGQQERIGRALALALAEPALRKQLHQGMAASLLVDHRLAFEEWLATDQRKGLAHEMAAQAEMSLDSLLSAVRDLGPMDLYLPSREDRATWTGEEAPWVIVEPSGSRDSFRSYDAAGRPTLRPRGSGRLPGPALLLQQSETRDERVGAVVPAGAAIQSLGEENLGGTLTLRNPGLPPRRVSLAALARQGGSIKQCPPDLEDDCGGGGGGPPISGGGGTTFLNGLSVNGVNDNGIPGESNEFEFRATAYIGTEVIGQGTLRLTGVSPNFEGTNMRVVIVARAPDHYAYLEVDVVETDGFLNDDDHFDYVQYQPNRVFFKVPLTTFDQGRWWPLKEQPHIGVFDPEKVVPQFTWLTN